MNTSKLVFIILNFAILQYTQCRKYKPSRDMAPLYGWKRLTYWPNRPYNGIRFADRLSLIIVNIPNYLNSTLNYTVIVPSVLIDRSRLLTAYNPLRDIIRNPKVADKLVVALVQSYTQSHTVGVHISEIVCARQLAYLPDDKNEHWHGTDRKHSPVHDIMILRGDEEFNRTGFTDYFTYDKKVEHRGWNYHGPITTYLASRHEKLRGTVFIYSLGFRTKEEMKDYDKIHELKTNAERTVVDCEEWMPRQWGYFICLKNEKNYPGLGAGAMLFSNNKLYGIGSFALWRNKTGILVFTDIRPYEELVNRTCTDEEFSFTW